MTDVPNLYRIILQVSNLDQATTFYSTLLDVPGRKIRGGRYYFDCGAVILALVDPAGDGAIATPAPDYIYFAVKDLEAVHARTVTLGCFVRDSVHGAPAGDIVKRPWGERSFYATDPFGNGLCFVDADTVFTGK